MICQNEIKRAGERPVSTADTAAVTGLALEKGAWGACRVPRYIKIKRIKEPASRDPSQRRTAGYSVLGGRGVVPLCGLGLKLERAHGSV